MIDKNKQYKTRNGREVRIYATDGEGMCSVHGAIKTKNGKWSVETWTEKGFWDSTEDIGGINDLVEIRPRIKRDYWANVSETGNIYDWHDTKKSADLCRGAFTKACVKIVIDCEEGEGL